MNRIAWHGRSPGPALRRALEAAGLGLSGDVRSLAIAQVFCAERIPDEPGTLPWIWLPAGPTDRADLEDAVRRGAYDAFRLDAAGESRLVARLSELAEPAADPPPTPGIIAESAAAQAMLQRVYRAAVSNMPV